MLGDRALRQDRILKRDQGIKVMHSKYFGDIIGASLSEPHIDRDNVPRRGECLYLCMWPRVAFVASMFPRTRLFT